MKKNMHLKRIAKISFRSAAKNKLASLEQYFSLSLHYKKFLHAILLMCGRHRFYMDWNLFEVGWGMLEIYANPSFALPFCKKGERKFCHSFGVFF